MHAVVIGFLKKVRKLFSHLFVYAGILETIRWIKYFSG